MSIALVSALVLQSDGRTTHPVEEYWRRFAHIVDLDLDVFLFLDDRLEAPPLPNHVHVQRIRLQDLPLWASFQSATDVRVGDNPQKNTLDYHLIQNSKTEFVRRALVLTSASHLAWVDFGVAGFMQQPAQTLYKLARIDGLGPGVVIPGTGRSGDGLDEIHWRFSGSFFCGDRASLEAMHDAHLDAVTHILPKATWEVNVWAWMEVHAAFPFRWYRGDHNDTLLDFDGMLPMQALFELKHLPEYNNDYTATLIENGHLFEGLYEACGRSFHRGCGSYLFDGQNYAYQLATYPKQRLLFEQAKKATKVLEVGVYMGHSLLIMLLANPTLSVVCVDNDAQFALPAVKFLAGHFPESRITFRLGNSTDVLPKLDETFDLFHVDGTHESAVVEQEFQQCVRLSEGDHVNIVFDDVDSLTSFLDSHKNAIAFFEKPTCLWPNAHAVFRKEAAKPTLESIVKPYSCLGPERLANIVARVREVNAKGIDGALVECGLWKGGGVGLMALTDDEAGGFRSVVGFDSFEGLPEPEVAKDGAQAAGWKGELAISFDTVQANLAAMGASRVRLVKGFFADSLPEAKHTLGPIAVLRLDGDWYSSTMDCLEHLYDLVVPGGFILMDDYGHWEGCRRATDEFRLKRNITAPLQRTDYTEMWWQKPLHEAPVVETPDTVARQRVVESWMPDDANALNEKAVRHYQVKTRLLAELQPRSVILLGVRRGYALVAMHVACPDAHFLAFDPMLGEDGAARRAHLDAVTERYGIRFSLIEADNDALRALPKADVAYVDGGRDTESVLNDLRRVQASKVILVEYAEHGSVQRALRPFADAAGRRVEYIDDGLHRVAILSA